LTESILAADGRDIGKGEAEPPFDRIFGFDDTAQFSANVLTGQFDFGK